MRPCVRPSVRASVRPSEYNNEQQDSISIQRFLGLPRAAQRHENISNNQREITTDIHRFPGTEIKKFPSAFGYPKVRYTGVHEGTCLHNC